MHFTPQAEAIFTGDCTVLSQGQAGVVYNISNGGNELALVIAAF